MAIKVNGSQGIAGRSSAGWSEFGLGADRVKNTLDERNELMGAFRRKLLLATMSSKVSQDIEAFDRFRRLRANPPLLQRHPG